MTRLTTSTASPATKANTPAFAILVLIIEPERRQQVSGPPPPFLSPHQHNTGPSSLFHARWITTGRLDRAAARTFTSELASAPTG